MALQTNALITLSRLKLDLAINASDTSSDAQLTNYINAASDQIEGLCNRRFKQESYTHRLTGKGDSYIIFEQFPVTTLTSVNNDDKWIFGSGTELVVDTQVSVDKETFLVRRGLCNPWKTMPMAVKVTYTAGYDAIPEGLQQACVEYCRYLYVSQSSRRLGISQVSKSGETATFEDTIPYMIKFLIEPYTREAYVKKALQLNGVMIFPDVKKEEKSEGVLR